MDQNITKRHKTIGNCLKDQRNISNKLIIDDQKSNIPKTPSNKNIEITQNLYLQPLKIPKSSYFPTLPPKCFTPFLVAQPILFPHHFKSRTLKSSGRCKFIDPSKSKACRQARKELPNCFRMKAFPRNPPWGHVILPWVGPGGSKGLVLDLLKARDEFVLCELWEWGKQNAFE